MQRYHRSERFQRVARHSVRRVAVSGEHTLFWLTDSAEAKTLDTQAGVPRTYFPNREPPMTAYTLRAPLGKIRKS